MDTNSVDYYVRREEQARALADAAIDPAIAAIHRELADQYRQRIDQTGPPSRA